MSEIEIEDYSLDFQDPAALSASVQAADQAASQATSAPQDPPIEPAAASRGRRPSRDAAARTSRRRTTPSPPPSRRPPPSPASSYASALSSAPAKAKWTVVGLRQALASSGVIIPRRSTRRTFSPSTLLCKQGRTRVPLLPPEPRAEHARTAALPTHGPSNPPLRRGRLPGRQDAAKDRQRVGATPRRPRSPATALLPDHPSGSSLLIPAESRSSPPQAAIAARARPRRRLFPKFRSLAPEADPLPTPVPQN
ncbi:GPI-anchored 58 [Labeo rohita]|uniref:GPI-anchored 58 n=1 Tax=Labeo rohita TaxID=84645 RepID=A0A498N400_LABRO|nr:GPI-anchored 58 [Labeo rohita]